MRKELGTWIKRRIKKGVGEQGDAAQKVLQSCGIPVDELQQEWMNQCATQLSIQARM